jgi:hypothetical protein
VVERPDEVLGWAGDVYWDEPVITYCDVSLMDTTVIVDTPRLDPEERPGPRDLDIS